MMTDPQRHRAWLWTLRQGVRAGFVQWRDVTDDKSAGERAAGKSADAQHLTDERAAELEQNRADERSLELVFVQAATNWPSCFDRPDLDNGVADMGLSATALRRGLAALRAFVSECDDDEVIDEENVDTK